MILYDSLLCKKKKKKFLVKVYGKRCPIFHFVKSTRWILNSLSKMTEDFKVEIDFGQTDISDDIIELLSNNLKEDLDRDSLKITLKESLAMVAKGTPLQKGPANDLLTCILRALRLVVEENKEEEEDAEESNGSRDLGTDPSMTQVIRDTGTNHKERSSNKDKTKGELCRYYARGRCNRPHECRFDHPGVCKKFRKWGSISSSTKGCDGKCESFHPNACRSSLKDKTCSWTDCRFYHLKGTKKTISKSNSNFNANASNNSNANQNRHNQNGQRNGQGARNRNNGNNNDNLNSGHNDWTNQQDQNGQRKGQNFPNQTRNWNQNQGGPSYESKNRFTGLNNQDPRQNTTRPDPEKAQLNQTLEAIMKRLSDMESRQASFQNQAVGTAFVPAHSLHNPVVPHLGSQTQRQWASQNQWTQSQSQPQY